MPLPTSSTCATTCRLPRPKTQVMLATVCHLPSSVPFPLLPSTHLSHAVREIDPYSAPCPKHKRVPATQPKFPVPTGLSRAKYTSLRISRRRLLNHQAAEQDDMAGSSTRPLEGVHRSCPFNALQVSILSLSPCIDNMYHPLRCRFFPFHPMPGWAFSSETRRVTDAGRALYIYLVGNTVFWPSSYLLCLPSPFHFLPTCRNL